MSPTQNAPTVGNLASAFWTAIVLYGASFVTLPGDGSVVLASGVALAIVAPVWLLGRWTQRKATIPRPPAGSQNEVLYTDADGNKQPLVTKGGKVAGEAYVWRNRNGDPQRGESTVNVVIVCVVLLVIVIILFGRGGLG